MFAPGLSRPAVMRVLFPVIAAMLLLTGCKSTRGSVKGRGPGYSVAAVGMYNLDDCIRKIGDPMGKALVSEAQGWIGTRYVYGGDSKSGTDCSGLVMRVYGNVCGLKIPRSTREQVRYCTKIARNKMRPGDLVFFASGKKEDKVSHVGLYIGDGKMIHASSSRGVIVSGFDSGYWGERYFTAGRVDGASRAFASTSGGKKADVARKKEIVPETPSPVPSPVSPSLASAPSVPSQPSAPSAQSTIDLLDLIINQKVDSIFTSQFAD